MLGPGLQACWAQAASKLLNPAPIHTPVYQSHESAQVFNRRTDVYSLSWLATNIIRHSTAVTFSAKSGFVCETRPSVKHIIFCKFKLICKDFPTLPDTLKQILSNMPENAAR